MKTKNKFKTKNWLRLDNMANLFPAIEMFSPAPIYRVSIDLDRKIEESKLNMAAENVIKRFPYFKVRLKKGIFWPYLENNKKNVAVSCDSAHPCTGINYIKNNHYLFRIKYHQNTIAIEILHALTDGGGALIFLKTLSAEYLRLCGEKIAVNKEMGIWDINEEPLKEEFKDSFFDYYNKDLKSLGIKSPAYHYKGTREKQDIVNIIKGNLNAKEVVEKAKKYSVSVTEYLTAVYLYSLYKVQKQTKCKKPIRISVPVNLRLMFPSKTMRNFTNFVICGISPKTGEYSFEDIVKQVYHVMRKGLIKNNMIKNFSGNVASEKNIFIRLLPLPIKMIMLSLIYTFKGENQYSGSLSNLGVIKFPEDMDNFIKDVNCYLAPNSINTTNCGVTCFKNNLVITFTRTVKESYIEKEFFSFFIKNKIKVKIESNI